MSFMRVAKRAFALLGLLMSAVSQTASPQSVSYRFQAIGSGRWGTSFFQGASVSFDLTADPSAVKSSPFFLCGTFDISYPGIRAVEGITGTLSILGVGSVQIPDMYVWSIGYQQRVGMGSCPTADIFEGAHPTLTDYDLTTSTGLLPLEPWTNVWFQNGNALETSAGKLTFSQVQSLTFEAVAVPEPAEGMLTTVGFAGLFVFARSRRLQRQRH